MYISKIKLENFRNLENCQIEVSDGINIIYGNNAQGKTNLLEAFWLFTGGHSFRGNKDFELIKLEDGKSLKKASLKANFISEEREQWAVLNIEKGKRNSVINGIEKKTGSALVGKICAVVFSPEHLSLIKDGPSKRRNFIDGAICQINPSYTKILYRYNRTLGQRNALLKEIIKNPSLQSSLDVWDEYLIKYGMEIIKRRMKYIKSLSPFVLKIYKGISKLKENLSINYFPLGINKDFSQDEVEIEKHYYNSVKKSRQADIKQCITNIGPHRDDINIFINDFLARTYGSQGQQRSAVLALKLGEADVLEKNIGEAPLILLDDVMSELDNFRQNYILNHLKKRQIFISCCNEESVNLLKDGKKFYVEKGKVTSVKSTCSEEFR